MARVIDFNQRIRITRRVFLGTEAVALGLATRVCTDPRAEALALASEIAGRSPDAIRAGKRLLNTALGGTAAAVLMAESIEQQALIGGANPTEAVRAGFEKRAPVFHD